MRDILNLQSLVWPKKLASSYPKLKRFNFKRERAFIYFLIKDPSTVLYVGRTSCLNSRIKTHTQRKVFDSVLYFETTPELASSVEYELIQKLSPKLNNTAGVFS